MYGPMPPPLPVRSCISPHMCCHMACWKDACPTASPVITMPKYGMSGELPYSTAAPFRALALNPDHAVAFCCTVAYPCPMNMVLSDRNCACDVCVLLYAWTLTA